jgi:LysM repeat protein
VFLALIAPGCSPVSDEELQSLRNETEALEGELARLKTEADILNRALDNVYREKDRVLDQLDQMNNPPAPEAEADPALVSLQDGAQVTSTATGQPTANQRVYKVVRGDTLSGIARDHNTSTEVLLRLNPFLGNRNDMLVLENDSIVVPSLSTASNPPSPSSRAD